jgi:pilus assembly protein CpaB
MLTSERQKKWVLLGVSITLGCGSAWSINNHLANKTRELESRNRVEYVNVLVAARELKQGDLIRQEDLKEYAFQVQGVAHDVVHSDDIDSVIGMRLRTDLLQGAWVVRSALAEPALPRLADRLGPSLRAITLSVDSVNAMSGLLKPGDHVDLFVSFDHVGRRITALLLGSVEIIATDQYTKDSRPPADYKERDYSTITVAVSPADSILLLTARQTGTISAALSAHDSVGPSRPSDAIAMNLAEMLGLREAGLGESAQVIYGDRLETEFEPQPIEAQRSR